MTRFSTSFIGLSCAFALIAGTALAGPRGDENGNSDTTGGISGIKEFCAKHPEARVCQFINNPNGNPATDIPPTGHTGCSNPKGCPVLPVR